MEFVKIFDNERKKVVEIALNEDRKIKDQHFRNIFPNARGIFVTKENSILMSVAKTTKKILNKTFLVFLVYHATTMKISFGIGILMSFMI